MKEGAVFESDLAEERRRASYLGGGVLFSERETDGITVSELTVTSAEGEKAIGREAGKYLTVSFPAPAMLLPHDEGAVKREICAALRALLPESPRRVLVAGLGNRRLTADSIGVLSAEGVLATVLDEGAPRELRPRVEVARVTPDTFGETGIEAHALIRSVASDFKPDAIIAVDALAAKGRERLLSAVELCDTGICPGTGVGNRREAISEKTLGVPVVAIGVPTVMRSAAFLSTALLASGETEESARRNAARGEGLFVVPPALDAGVRLLSRLLAEALNEALA